LCDPRWQGLSRRTPSPGTGRHDEAKQGHTVNGQESIAWRLSRRLPRVGPARRVVAAAPTARGAPDSARRPAACRCGEGDCMYHPPPQRTTAPWCGTRQVPVPLQAAALAVTVSGGRRWSLFTGQTEAVDKVRVRWLGQKCVAVETAQSPKRRQFTGADEPLPATRFLDNSCIQRTSV